MSCEAAALLLCVPLLPALYKDWAASKRSWQSQLVKKDFDKPVDGEARSPATATLTSFC